MATNIEEEKAGNIPKDILDNLEKISKGCNISIEELYKRMDKSYKEASGIQEGFRMQYAFASFYKPIAKQQYAIQKEQLTKDLANGYMNCPWCSFHMKLDK